MTFGLYMKLSNHFMYFLNKFNHLIFDIILLYNWEIIDININIIETTRILCSINKS